VFAPQKGLPHGDIAAMDAGLVRMAGMLAGHCGASDAVWERPHSGAAGGIALALELACGARIVSGFSVFCEWTGLREKIAAADLVLTGEGSLDAGSLSGKGPVGVARAASAAGKRVFLLCGRAAPAAARALESESPLISCRTITPEGMPVEEAFAAAPELLGKAVRELLRDIAAPDA
ncbi:MAG TPA: glycerate kinase, partial [Opitutales bacterium]|nr:glycerate kinase [Opitutales bacterium]